jgi:dTDP-4-amino-4,6-dideoxygalactose transaminase
MPEAPWGRCTRGRGHLLGWLTGITVDPQAFGADREAIRLALEAADIESRPLWKPMHLQSVFQGCEVVGGNIAGTLFHDGLCLPSGTALTEADLARVAEVARGVMGRR